MINDEISKEDHTPSTKDEGIKEDEEEKLHKDEKQETLNQLPQDWIISKDHMLDQILRDMKRGVSTRSLVNNFRKYFTFISKIEPKSIFDDLLDEGWLLTMQ